MAKTPAATARGTKRTTLTLTDPRAIRAIAHEARQEGIVERDEASSDGRERPWRAGAQYLQLGHGEGASGTSVRQAANAVISTLLAGMSRSVDVMLRSGPSPQGTQVSHGRLYLTDGEAAALNQDLDELVRRYDAGRTSRNKPVDASARDQYWLLLPHSSEQGR